MDESCLLIVEDRNSCGGVAGAVDRQGYRVCRHLFLVSCERLLRTFNFPVLGNEVEVQS